MAALEQMTLDDVSDFHGRAYQPANAVLIVVGDLTHGQALEDAAKSFGAWAAAPSAGRVVAASRRAGAGHRQAAAGGFEPARRNPNCASATSACRAAHLTTTLLVVANLVLAGSS